MSALIYMSTSICCIIWMMTNNGNWVGISCPLHLRPSLWWCMFWGQERMWDQSRGSREWQPNDCMFLVAGDSRPLTNRRLLVFPSLLELFRPPVTIKDVEKHWKDVFLIKLYAFRTTNINRRLSLRAFLTPYWRIDCKAMLWKGPEWAKNCIAAILGGSAAIHFWMGAERLGYRIIESKWRGQSRHAWVGFTNKIMIVDRKHVPIVVKPKILKQRAGSKGRRNCPT